MKTYYVTCSASPGMKLFKVEAPNEDSAVNQVINFMGGWEQTLVFDSPPLDHGDNAIELRHT